MTLPQTLTTSKRGICRAPANDGCRSRRVTMVMPRLNVLAWWSAARSAKGWSSSWIAKSRLKNWLLGVTSSCMAKNKRFFCMVNDVVLNATNPAIQGDPPDISDPFLYEVYSGIVAYGTISVAPMLSLDEEGTPKPVKSIPSHFTEVFNASEKDVNDVFGAEDESHFNVGKPLELEQTQVNLDLRRLTERSVGVFGKSGTGKSFLTRVILAGVMARGQAVSLIFDMHNDYGWEIVSENGRSVKGLKQLFPAKVSICTLDAESSRRRKAPYDFEVKLGYNEIEPEDIAMLRGTMSLSDAMIDAAYTLSKRWGTAWVWRLLEGRSDDIDEIVENTNIMGGTLAGLQRRLERFQRWEFLVKESTGDTVKNIVSMLDNNKSVVLEFGRYGSSLEAYILVANYLSRRIHESYVERVEKALGDKGMEPPQLLITIEEAHKFLDPLIARQTIFGIIAREMRKYKVTLLIVDQRPSGIDEEVMSQIGTRVTALLDNERDINAVLNGISGAGGLREVLARLDTKQQAIIMGHAVPMPVVIKTRGYDEDFYAAMQGTPIKTEDMRKTLGNSGKERRVR
ncbi:MAG: ATP-binding protein [Anaerolineae bacterium]